MLKYAVIFLLVIVLGAVLTQAQTSSPTPATGTFEAEKQRADRLQARFNDYANFARYRESNAKLALPAKNENRVVFMGDSITAGWKLEEYFPNQLFINRGISGQTTSQMLLRFRQDVINLKPKAVVILAGTNDIAGSTGTMTVEAIEENLASMIELAHANAIKVIVASILPVSDYNKNKAGNPIVRTIQRPPSHILAINDWLKKYASAKGVIYLDYYSATVDDKGFLKADLANDGLHPNDKGYGVMQPLAAEAIQTALKKKQKAQKSSF